MSVSYFQLRTVLTAYLDFSNLLVSKFSVFLCNNSYHVSVFHCNNSYQSRLPKKFLVFFSSFSTSRLWPVVRQTHSSSAPSKRTSRSPPFAARVLASCTSSSHCHILLLNSGLSPCGSILFCLLSSVAAISRRSSVLTPPLLLSYSSLPRFQLSEL